MGPRSSIPRTVTVGSVRGLDGVPEDDGRSEDDRAGDECDHDRGDDATGETDAEADEEQDDGDGEQSVADPLAELDEVRDAGSPLQDRIRGCVGHGDQPASSSSRANEATTCSWLNRRRANAWF